MTEAGRYPKLPGDIDTGLVIQASDLPPDAEQAASAASARLRAGDTLCALVVADPQACAAAAQAVIDDAADLATRFLMIGNPLRAPLTLQRVMIQATGCDIEGSHELSPPDRARLIAGPVADEARVVAVIQQAETLDLDAVTALREMEHSFRTEQPRVQILFAGAPALLGLLAGQPAPPPVVAAPPPQATVQAAQVQPAPALAAAPAAATPALVPARSRRWVWLLVLLTLLAAAATAIVVLRPDLLMRAGITLPAWITDRLPVRSP